MAFIEKINSPDELKELTIEELSILCKEIRELIINTVSKNGGHLGSNLGTVELITMLHRVFDYPNDNIIFDVGHQAYTHKILTGRKETFNTLRKIGGCAGFPCQNESKFDIGYSGHAGVAISTALGMAEAKAKQNQSGKVIAIVGDGSLTNGNSLEGLNNIASCIGKKNIIVILNDNNMSISQNVGSISRYLNRIISNSLYNRSRNALKMLLKNKIIYKIIKKIETMAKGVILPPGKFFEELGLRYIGPINGHDLNELANIFLKIKQLSGPIIIHVVTEKGHDCKYATESPTLYHGVSGFDVVTGRLKENSKPNFSKTAGETLCEIAKKDSKVVAISAAMISGTGLEKFAKEFPNRTYDVGIAESHAVIFAAGLALGNMRPFCIVYSTFMQRAFDNIYHDICLPNLPVTMLLDRAGVVEDGPTHHGIYDISFLRTMPNLSIMQPSNPRELAEMINFAHQHPSPIVIRYSKGSGADYSGNIPVIELGKAQIITEGRGKVVIWTLGSELETGLNCIKILDTYGIKDVTLINCRFILPFDKTLALKYATDKLVVSIEDHSVTGGLASILDECLNNVSNVQRLSFGWNREVIAHGNKDKLKEYYGLNAESIAEKIKLSLGE